MGDLLTRIAQSGLAQAKRTEQILDEMFAAIRRNRPDLDPAKLDRTRSLMASAVRDWKVEGYESLIDAVKLPDPDDRRPEVPRPVRTRSDRPRPLGGLRRRAADSRLLAQPARVARTTSWTV